MHAAASQNLRSGCIVVLHAVAWMVHERMIATWSEVPARFWLVEWKVGCYAGILNLFISFWDVGLGRCLFAKSFDGQDSGV